MPTKRQLKSGNWNVQVRIKGYKPIANTFPTETEADEWARKIEDQLRGAPAEKPTWREMALLYCDVVLTGKPSRHLKVGRSNLIGEMLPAKPYDQLKVAEINAFKLKRLEAGASPTTVHDDLVFIRRVYRWIDREARSQGNEPVGNPAEFVTIPKPNPPRSRIISPKELERLLSALTPVMRSVVELAYETAMRRSEITNLRAKHVNISDRILDVIDGKEGDRSVPLSKRACQILAEALKHTQGQDSRVFRKRYAAPTLSS